MMGNTNTGRAEATAWLGRLLNPQAEVALPDEAGIGVLIDVANAHYLVPALYRALQERQGLDGLPDAAIGYMQTMDEFAVSHHRMLRQQLVTVLDTLKETLYLRPVLLKGAAILAEDIYPAAHTRHMFDLDLLLPPDTIETAVAQLRAQGYRFAPGKGENGLAEHAHHAPPLLPPERGVVSVELHRAALAPRSMPLLRNHRLFASAEPATNVHARLPSPTHQLWMAFVHSQLSHQHHRIRRFDLRHGLDVVHLTRHYGERIDWSWIDYRAEKYRCREQLQAYYSLLDNFVQYRVPGYCSEPKSQQYVKHVRRRMEQGMGPLDVLSLRASDLIEALRRVNIERRYERGGIIRLQLNRLRLLVYLLGKYSRPESWREHREREWRRLGL